MPSSLISSDDDANPPQDAGGPVRKPAFLDDVVTRSGLKKRDAKIALEAALATLAEALIRGDELAVPPLGKLRVIKTKQIGGGAMVLTLKLRTMKDGAGKDGAGAGKSGLAETDEAD
ncbi:HU family DNA-binding protein [Yoonia sp.]|uniref:HU family DNA-binding protein n=1 Tax=Yoonia sp. TaxID=2212373 RepID=UPI003F6B1D89